MAAKETLQLRHQLSCSGIAIQSATYDTTRHHVLTYDSNALMPHMLRLFSLRREIKCVKLFDETNPPPATTTLPPSEKNSKGTNPKIASEGAESVVVVVHSLALEYARNVDVYICVYTAQSVSRETKLRHCKEELAVYNVLFLEPVSLKKLVNYPGPVSHNLRCAFYDACSDRLVLAIRQKQSEMSRRKSRHISGSTIPSATNNNNSHREQLFPDETSGDGEGDDDGGLSEEPQRISSLGPMHNHVDILQISKRRCQTGMMRHTVSRSTVEDEEQPRTILCVEKAGPSMFHSETIDHVCGSKGLTRLFGVGLVSVGSSASATVESFVVEWRENSERSLELIRRVMCHDVITAIALSPCSTWLFTGHQSGALNVWNVGISGSKKSRITSYGLGTSPLEPEPSAWHKSAVSSVKIGSSVPSADTEDDGVTPITPTEVMVVTAARDSGLVKHWRFHVDYQSKVSDDAYDLGAASAISRLPARELLPRIELVGAYNTDSNLNSEHENALIKKRQLKKLVDSVVATVPLWVTIDVGGFAENLLLILREDVIHVLKVQSVLHVLQAVPVCEGISSVRMVDHRSMPKVVALSGNHLASVRVFPLDCSDPNVQQLCYQQQLGPPRSQRSSSVSAMECFKLDQQRAFVVYGWSSGGVEIHSLYPSRRVVMLQDPHLNVHITAIGVVIHHSSHGVAASELLRAPAAIAGASSTTSWGGLLKSSSPMLLSDTQMSSGGIPDAAADARHGQKKSSTVYILAGTANGQIFGWKVPLGQDASSNASHQFVLESKIRVNAAHSTHVVQLAELQHHTDGVHRLVSLGADGMVKVWELPSMSIVGHVNAATGSHMSIASCMHIVQGDRGRHLVVGFEDGMLAVWKLDPHQVSFSEVQVASHHERSVTRICNTNETSGRSGNIEFLTCSLDMTVIVWSIKGGIVEETRYFDIGSPVIGIHAVGNQAVVALAHEVCKFDYCTQTPPSSDEISQRSSLEKLDPNGRSVGASTELQFYGSSPRPDTPTTYSDNEVEVESDHPARRAERVVNALRIPTSTIKAEDSIAIPSASPTFTAKPVDNEAHDVVAEETKSDVRLKTPIHGDDLCGYLEQYVESHGTNGTIAASNLSHFLSTRRLAIVKTPDFAIRKYLQEKKIDPKTRLSVYDACEILLALQDSADAKKGKHAKKQQHAERKMHQEKIRLRKRHERDMASRRAVISFNILGEKSIRWEVLEPAHPNEPPAHQDADVGSVQCSGEAQELQSPKSPSIRVPTDQVLPPSAERSDIVDTDGRNAIALVEGNAEGANEDLPPKRRRSRKISVAECIGPRVRDEFPDPELIQRLKLSKGFQSQWSGGYCWCAPCSELRVAWGEENRAGVAAAPTTCELCRKRKHTLMLSKSGYRPHFSLRMILGIIVDVYHELMTPSHTLLFKSAAKDPAGPRDTSSDVSIHCALFRVFTKKFGMPTVVQDKIKLFMVSITHFVREVDAIAVFGELLGVFARDQSYDDAHVPDEMVALCVCCYSWFYSRAMVVNGEPILGSNRDSGHSLYGSQLDGPIEIENGKRTNWQFVKLENALLCAEEILMYPLVSPGYLRNILLYAEEYAQACPSKPNLAGEIDAHATDDGRCSRVTWIEVHRFLRLLVGEWKQQNTEFRVVERTLFVQPLMEAAPSSSTETRAEVIEKLRLILSCFIFYDHEREGVMAVEDFANILRKLRYLWPNENVTAEEAASTDQVSLTFENTILAAKRRFADLGGDGQICYLDFWAMLYIVGVKSLALLKFREIPSFCREYKLDISADLHGLLLCYMQRSSSMMLPRGFQLGKSSVDQRVSVQHRRRVGGLHDGLFTMPNTLGTSLSLQQLLTTSEKKAQDGAFSDQIYLDGSAPALRQNASVSAMDRFRPISRDSSDSQGQHLYGVSPVVFGVRPAGVRKKPRAFLAVSAIANDVLPSSRGLSCDSSVQKVKGKEDVALAPANVMDSRSSEPNAAAEQEESAFSNVYIQFPYVSPRHNRLEMPPRENGHAGHHIVGRIAHLTPMDDNSGAYQWHAQIMKEHEEQQQETSHALCDSILEDSEDADHDASVAHGGTTLDASPSRSGSHRNDRKANRRISRVSKTAVDQAAETSAPSKPVPNIPTMEPTTRKKKKEKMSEAVVVVPKMEKAPAKTPAPTGAVTVDTIKHRLPPRINKPSINENVEPEQPPPMHEPAGEIEKWETMVEDNPIKAETWKPEVKDTLELLVTDATEAVVALMTFLPVAQVQSIPSIVCEVDPSAKDAVGATEEFGEPEDDDEEESGGDDECDDQGEEVDAEEEECQDSSDDATARTASIESAPAEYADLNVETSLQTNARSENAEGWVSAKCLGAEENGNQTPTPDELSALVLEKEKGKFIPAEQPTVTEVSSNASATARALPQEIPAVVDASPRVLSIEAPIPVQHAVVQSTAPAKGLSRPKSPRKDASAPPKGSDLSSHHSFRFSQQPAFRSTAPALNNPFRSGQWNPDDDSDSDDEQAKKASVSAGAVDENGDGDDDNIEDIELRLTPEALQAFRASFGPRMHRSGLNPGVRPPLRHFGVGVTAVNHFDSLPSRKRGLTRESNLSASRRKTGSVLAARLDEEAERALYGDKPPSALGDGIVFTAEAEEHMQQRWLAFFNHAETTMFSPLKQELEDREEAQRREEDEQSKLIKKRQEQQAQDTLRLQQSRRESAVIAASNGGNAEKSASAGAADSANFRLRRMTRESCHELLNGLQYGVSVEGECKNVEEAHYFFLEYNPDADGSILTLKLRVERGEAKVFMSTETKVPCASDFMWRSVETSKGFREGEGQKLVLYPHQLAKVVSTATAASAGQVAGSDSHGSSLIPFYISVTAVEADTKFALSIMASGQKIEPSRAIATVDSLIEQFNQLSKSFEGRASPRCSAPVSSIANVEKSPSLLLRHVNGEENSCARQSGDLDASSKPRLSGFGGKGCQQRSGSFVDHMQSHRKISRFGTKEDEEVGGSFAVDNQNPGSDGDSDADEDAEGESCSPDAGEDVRSFQHLLESISEKRGYDASRSKSFFLAGPTSDQFEFIQDEEANLKETTIRLSPERVKSTNMKKKPFESSGQDAITVATERRLTLHSKKQLISARKGSRGRLMQRLSPLKPGGGAALLGGKNPAAITTLRVAKCTPKPVAYSLSSLDRAPHHTATPSSTTLQAPRKPMLPQVHSTSSLPTGSPRSPLKPPI